MQLVIRLLELGLLHLVAAVGYYLCSEVNENHGSSIRLCLVLGDRRDLRARKIAAERTAMTEKSGMTEVVRMLMEDHARQDEEDARRERERAAEREQCM